MLPDLQSKFDWVFSHIVKFVTMGKVLIFVTKKVDAEEVAKKLVLRDLEIVLLHGDMLQQVEKIPKGEIKLNLRKETKRSLHFGQTNQFWLPQMWRVSRPEVNYSKMN